ncbi:MAG: GNAT family N-acetyltransferase [Burkholderiales bacterium]|nr:GNAT family N-acetyltransferase [Burkholderiales bacterium]
MSSLTISTNPKQLDHVFIHRYLSEQSYWAKGMRATTLRKALANSLCFGGFLDGQQIAFARVVTDFATFAYLRDVFVDTPYQRRGYGKTLMQAILQHPELAGVTLLLHTNDAHDFYEKFGFFKPAMPERQMLRRL